MVLMQCRKCHEFFSITKHVYKAFKVERHMTKTDGTTCYGIGVKVR